VTKFAVRDHEMVPEHVLLTPDEADEVLKGFGIEAPQLPKIHVNDPAAKEIGAKVGRYHQGPTKKYDGQAVDLLPAGNRLKVIFCSIEMHFIAPILPGTSLYIITSTPSMISSIEVCKRSSMKWGSSRPISKYLCKAGQDPGGEAHGAGSGRFHREAVSQRRPIA